MPGSPTDGCAARAGAGRRTGRETVLVGVDGSPGSRAALRWASRWADRHGSNLVAVAAWQYPPSAALPGGPVPRSPDETDSAADEELRAAVSDELGSGVRQVRFEIGRGPAAAVLLDLAVREEASMIVVGRRGLGRVEGRILGSVSRRVAELATCPVAVVPSQDVPDGAFVVGIDGSHASRRACAWAICAAARSGVGVVLVHGVTGITTEMAPSAIDALIDRAWDLLARHADEVSAAGVEPVSIVRAADPRRALRSVADEYGAGAIVIGSTGTGSIAGVLAGSVVTDLAQHCDRPVVIVPDDRDA